MIISITGCSSVPKPVNRSCDDFFGSFMTENNSVEWTLELKMDGTANYYENGRLIKDDFELECKDGVLFAESSQYNLFQISNGRQTFKYTFKKTGGDNVELTKEYSVFSFLFILPFSSYNKTTVLLGGRDNKESRILN